jgi:hypothetical protein
VDGILNINKPQGKTSFSIVSLVKRFSGEKRVGHAGTLDPLATGVLPVCLGQGTRVIPFLLEAAKSYRAEIEPTMLPVTSPVGETPLELAKSNCYQPSAALPVKSSRFPRCTAR